MPYNKVIFERLTPIHRPLVKYYRWRRKEVRFLGNTGAVKDRDWLSRLVRQGKITEIPPIGYVYHDCYGNALDNLENFYPYFAEGSRLAREMVKLYGDENIGLAYKKEITRQLAEFYYINSYLYNEENRLEDNERILFIPLQYHRFLKMAEESGACYHRHSRIDFICCLSLSGLYGFSRKARAWLLQSGITAYYLIKLFLSRGSGQAKAYHYAIPIRSPDYQLKFQSRSVDFLLNGKEINKENTIFLLLNPAITQENRDEIKAKKLDVLDCSKRFVSFPRFNIKDKFRILRKVLPYAIKNMFLGLFDNSVILDVNNTLLQVFLQWSSILGRVSFNHLVTLNDEGVDHIGRNILLNREGAKTWYYAHSNSFGYLHVLPGEDIKSRRHWLWSFLYYDYYVSWNDEMIQYYKLHPQQISNYLSVGCIWSQAIVEVLEGRLTSSLSKEIFADFQRDDYKMLAFFDSSYLPNSVSPLEDGVAFYQAILSLLEEFAHILVLVKEKKSEESVLKVYERFGGSCDVFYEQYQPVLDELRRHPRCYVTGYKGDPSEVIAMSDLTITYAFSSSTVEALCAGKRAIFFDPGNRWRGCRYDNIPNFVAHNYQELKYLIHKILYETSDEEYRDFLHTYVKNKIDPYLDGKAVTRFQKLLGEYSWK